MSVLPTGIAAASGGYEISRSVRLRSSASAYLNRTAGTPTNQIKWTFSGWIKRGSLGVYSSIISGGTTANDYSWYGFDNNDKFQIIHSIGGAGQSDSGSVSTAVFRDPSAWYHVVIVYDSANATSANRTILYVNGIQQTLSAFPSLNETSSVNANSVTQYIANRGYSALYNDCYITEVNFIDGQALTPSSFGENDAITGVWKPKRYAGTYGTNGFYLNFSDNSAATAAAIGKDSSGNGNNWTPNNISVTSGVTYDSMTDVPTLTSATVANYCVLNPLDRNSTYGSVSDGNLTQSVSTANHAVVFGSMAMPSGKTYLEVTSGTTTSATPLLIAFGLATQSAARTGYGNTNTWSIKCIDARTLWNGGSSSSNFGSAFTSGTTLQLAYDSLTGYMWIGDGTNWYNSTGGTTGNPSAGTNPSFTISTTEALFFFMDCYAGSGTVTAYANFGQRPFAYTPPTGFKALNTQNLPDATITAGNKHSNTVLWTGNGASSRSFTGWGFAPDFVWMKSRSSAANHALIDKVRGTGAKVLESDLTSAENSDGLSVTSFDSDGFTGATGSVNFSYANSNTQSYVGWGWKAGGTAVSNTAGSITSSVSANASAGFSVVTYTTAGANGTVGHGLGVAPKMVIVKSRNNASGWSVYHSSVGNTGALNLQATTATSTSIDWWSNTSPTSTVFSFGGNLNFSGWTWVAYCFSEVAGYSKFGSYVGNGSADGPFVYCGFRPRWVMVKRTDTSGSGWVILDTSRDTYNAETSGLIANASDAEATGYLFDGLSNGFKVRNTGSGQNASGGTYIFAAFAEVPFRNALAR